MRKPCPACGGTSCAHQAELPLLTPAANLIEFREIRKFTAACRDLWPGAAIVMRPNSAFAHQCEPTPGEPANQTTNQTREKGD